MSAILMPPVGPLMAAIISTFGKLCSTLGKYHTDANEM